MFPGACLITFDNGDAVRAASIAYCTSHSVPIWPQWLPFAAVRAQESRSAFQEAELNLPATQLHGKVLAISGLAYRAARLSQVAVESGAAHVILLLQGDLVENNLPLEVGSIHPQT